jgi:hypothetical protein
MGVRRRLVAGALILGLSAFETARGEVQVNVSTTGSQRSPGVATAPDGSSVVVWTSFVVRNGGFVVEKNDILLRRYGPDGAALGGEAIVPIANASSAPRVAMAGDGSFAVVVDTHQGLTELGIRVQRYDATGSPLGTDVIVGFGDVPEIAMAPGGGFVVSWATGSYLDREVRARAFDASGTPLGPEIVAGFQGDHGPDAKVGMADDGSFVIVWSGDDGNGTGVLARRYDATGTPLAPAFVVNDSTAGSQSSPDVAVAADGSFVVAWLHRPNSFTVTHRAKRYDAAGAPLGPEFSVGDSVDGLSGPPRIALAADGSFVVVTIGDDGDKLGVFARRFDANDALRGPAVQLNGFETGDQNDPVVAWGVGDRYVVAWQSDTFDRSETAVVMQRLVEGFVEQPVDAARLVMSRHGTRESVIFRSTDPRMPFPPIGSREDPATGSPGGALLELFSATEGTAQLVISPGLGNPGWSAKHKTNTDSLKFLNREAPAGPSAVKRVTLKGRKILKLQASAIGLPLAGAQTSVAVRFTSGRYRACALFDASTIRTDQTNHFSAVHAVGTALPDCSDATLTAIP